MNIRPFILPLGWVLHLIAFVMVCLHCLRRRRNTGATLLWIVAAWSFPFLGPLIYLAFGIDRVSDRGDLKHRSDERLLRLRTEARNAVPQAYWHTCPDSPPCSPVEQQFNRVLDTLIPDHPPLTGNHICPLIGGDEAYPRMLDAIRNAQHHVHLQSFIIKNDRTSREFIELLREKAEAGIEVRVLYDRFGSTAALLGRLFKKSDRIPAFQSVGWTQANPMRRQFQINLRNHRKLLVIDGSVGFFGGLNIQDAHRSRPGQPPIRDYHFEARGPLVQELQYSFLRDWTFMTDEEPDALLTSSFFPRSEPAGGLTARLISAGPSTRQNVAATTYFNAITLAEKQILAVTPYFVPPPDLLHALKSAALRGVDVRLIVPAANNHPIVYHASRALYEELLQAGARIFERAPPFMHAKALVIDSLIVLTGTANLDERSLNLNYETIVAVYSDTFSDAIKQMVHEELDLSDEVHLARWRRRPSRQRLLENLCALLNPVL